MNKINKFYNMHKNNLLRQANDDEIKPIPSVSQVGKFIDYQTSRNSFNGKFCGINWSKDMPLKKNKSK